MKYIHHSSANNILIIPQLKSADIAEALDRKCMAALVLLDLSAAFDIIDHKSLQTCLEHSFGVTGSVMSWIKSYLSDRS